ncbi:MAG: hypothetical protein ACM3JC_12680 [Rudaea sp.]
MPRRSTRNLEVHPLTPDRFGDLVTLFNGRGGSQVRWCWCMYYRRSGAGERPAGTSVAVHNRRALEALVDAGTVPGLIGYRDSRPIAWVSVGPREDYAKLARSPIMKPVDDLPVWSVVCFFTTLDARGEGVAEAMLAHAAAFARANGARLLEAYPVDKAGRGRDDALWFGAKEMYDRAGFTEVARRKPTRPVVRKRLGR